jgi:hypothetical protein
VPSTVTGGDQLPFVFTPKNATWASNKQI